MKRNSTEPKNLFSYTVHPDREDKNRSTDVFDVNAYTAQTLSPDLKADKDRLYDGWLEAKAQREERESNVGCIVESLADLLGVLIFGIGDFVSEFLTDAFWSSVTFILPILCLGLYWGLLYDKLKPAMSRFAYRLYIKKHPAADVNEKALDPRLSETVAAARTELGIPDHAWELDILPYRHGVTSVGETYEIRPLGAYDNIPVLIWREGQVLFLSDEDIVLRIPLSEISEVKHIKKKTKFQSWYKLAAPDTEPYKEDKVYTGWPYHACKSRIEIILRDDSCLLVPGYDASVIRNILGDTFPI